MQADVYILHSSPTEIVPGVSDALFCSDELFACDRVFLSS